MIHSLSHFQHEKLTKKKKKKFEDAQIAEKKFPTTVMQTEDFFLAPTGELYELLCHRKK